MGCCGQNRELQRNSGVAPARETRTPVLLEFTGDAPVRVLGPTSLKRYNFSPEQRVQSVDPLDARAILRTGLFRRPGAV